MEWSATGPQRVSVSDGIEVDLFLLWRTRNRRSVARWLMTQSARTDAWPARPGRKGRGCLDACWPRRQSVPMSLRSGPVEGDAFGQALLARQEGRVGDIVSER